MCGVSGMKTESSGFSAVELGRLKKGKKNVLVKETTPDCNSLVSLYRRRRKRTFMEHCACVSAQSELICDSCETLFTIS